MTLILPRGYLSSSALDLWESSPKQYAKKYFEGEDIDRPNDFMSFGKKLAQHIETGEFGDDAMIAFAKGFLPSYGHAEHEQITLIDTPYGAIKLLSKFDDFNPDTIEVLEHKTGKTVWTKSRVQKHKQLRFYAVSCYYAYNKIPVQTLTWIETAHIGGIVRPTGKVEQFTYIATLNEIEEKKQQIINACLQIDKAYKNYLNKINK